MNSFKNEFKGQLFLQFVILFIMVFFWWFGLLIDFQIGGKYGLIRCVFIGIDDFYFECYVLEVVVGEVFKVG